MLKYLNAVLPIALATLLIAQHDELGLPLIFDYKGLHLIFWALVLLTVINTLSFMITVNVDIRKEGP